MRSCFFPYSCDPTKRGNANSLITPTIYLSNESRIIFNLYCLILLNFKLVISTPFHDDTIWLRNIIEKTQTTKTNKKKLELSYIFQRTIISLPEMLTENRSAFEYPQTTFSNLCRNHLGFLRNSYRYPFTLWIVCLFIQWLSSQFNGNSVDLKPTYFNDAFAVLACLFLG